ncbi:ABC transporter ATP-binding protein [Frondihabitans australicus]|uniref:ABC-type dipeptide/oligopeptide/nickel transport system ATPase component n=1 Tax=Frondihabitans australicus TaxID=386892 RepID=A0A495IHG3_9MICO|nr:ABC transporter ATP-binding protein [Frondihabitans australicus]RKR75199.1 ABC-type dipeptide/oligopeptide/nickel transport system ATPase component [Frondihabitans australicus]
MTTTAPSAAASTAPGAAVLAVDGVQIYNHLQDTVTVESISFEVRPGRALGIVGESGSGKTITCRALLGILPELFEVSEGTITLAGRDTATLSRSEWTALRGTTISAVFQDPASYLNPSIPVGKQLAEILRVKKGQPRRAAKQNTIELLEKVRIHDPEYVYFQYPFELSGGMLQRVLIAAAVACEPQVLIADEATTALDVTVQAEILDLLTDLKDSLGLALIVVSHDLAVVAELCDEVLVMREGQVVEQGPTERVLYEPSHEYTRLLLDEHHRFGLERFLRKPEETA